MKVLLDHNVPRVVLRELTQYEADTAAGKGWTTLSNGRLLSRAEEDGYSLLITLDKGFQHQQNMSGRAISVVILDIREQGRTAILMVTRKLALRMPNIRPGEVLLVGAIDWEP